MYNLDDKLHFGKYEGYSIREIFCGQKNLSQRFLNDFLDFKLKDLKFTIDDCDAGVKNFNIIKVEIKDLEILVNNKLIFDLQLSKNDQLLNRSEESFDRLFDEAFGWANFELLLDDRIEAKEMFDHPNDVIFAINKKNATEYLPSSDADYINWCLKNLDTFYFLPQDIINLQNEICNHFYGVGIFRGENWSNLYTYETITKATNYKFDTEAVELNSEKYHSKKKSSSKSSWQKSNSFSNEISENVNFSNIDDPQYSDGYGGYHDNDMIDDAFEGDPDNYWNID